MKMTLLSILSFAAIASASAGQASSPGAFRVLLVGVDHYSKGNTKWSDLDGTKDVDMMRRVVTMYWGMTPGLQIHELRDDKATKSAIEGEFRNWLVKDAKPTDRMLFFFSGHGTLVPAPDLPTGRRSAVLPYDAKADAKGIEPASVVTGAFFRDQLRDLRERGVTNLTLMFDACNSAAIARGGVAVSKAVPNPAMELAPAPKGQSAAVGLSTDLDLSEAMVISAARADRSAWQGDGGGNLTVALAQAVHTYFGRRGQAKVDHDMTYRDLKDGILANLSSLPQPVAQEPAFSGALDREVFGAKTDAVEPYYLLSVAGEQAKVAAGSLFAVGPGAVFAIYAPGTTNFAAAKPVARAVVTKDGSDPYQSSVTIEGYQGDIKALNGGRARLIDGTPDAALAVDLSELDANPAYKKVADGIVAGSLFRRSDARNPLQAKVIPPGAVAKGFSPKANAWTLADAAGKDLLTVDSGSSTLVEQIRGGLRQVAQRKAVLDLATPLPLVSVEMQIVPVTVSNGLVSKVDEAAAISGASADLPENQAFAIRVRATLGDGKLDPSKSAYLALLDLPPNGRVDPLWPSNARAGEATRIVADGKWLYLGLRDNLVGANTPGQLAAWHLDPKDGEGQEVFKLMASDVSDVDYSPLLSPARRGEKGKGEESPIGRVLTAFRDGLPVSRAPRTTATPTDFSVTGITLNLKRSDTPPSASKP